MRGNCIRKTSLTQAYKVMYGLWGMGQMMFTKYVVVGADVDVHNTSEDFDSRSKLGIDKMKKLPGQDLNGPWRPLMKMDEAIKRRLTRFIPTEVGSARLA